MSRFLRHERLWGFFANSRDLPQCSMWASFIPLGSVLCNMKDSVIGRKEVRCTSVPRFMDAKTTFDLFEIMK